MAPTEEMVAIALDIKPNYVTLVPEKREEVTTEGGIDIIANFERFCTEKAIASGLRVNAGHGLTYWNVYPVASILELPEFAEIKAKCPQPAVAVISTNSQFITWLKLRLEYVFKGEFQAPSDSIKAPLASLESVV
jgi:hypothetical protein